MDKRKIQKNITIFADRAKKQLHADRVILFGSFVRGKTTDHSDVDVVVVSRAFASIPFEKRLDALYPLTQDLTPDFHVFGYTPGEYRALSPLTSVAEAKKYGRIIV